MIGGYLEGRKGKERVRDGLLLLGPDAIDRDSSSRVGHSSLLLSLSFSPISHLLPVNPTTAMSDSNPDEISSVLFMAREALGTSNLLSHTNRTT